MMILDSLLTIGILGYQSIDEKVYLNKDEKKNFNNRKWWYAWLESK